MSKRKLSVFLSLALVMTFIFALPPLAAGTAEQEFIPSGYRAEFGIHTPSGVLLAIAEMVDGELAVAIQCQEVDCNHDYEDEVMSERALVCCDRMNVIQVQIPIWSGNTIVGWGWVWQCQGCFAVWPA